MKFSLKIILLTFLLTSCEQIQNTLDSAFGNKEQSEKANDENVNRKNTSSNKNEDFEAPNDGNNQLQTPCYIVCVSAYKDIDDAIEKAKEIRYKGYNADYLYLPDYASLSKKLYYTSYIGPVFSESECQRLVRQARRDYKDAYGILVSDDPEWRVTIRPEGVKRRRY